MGHARMRHQADYFGALQFHVVTWRPTDSTETYTRTSCLLPGSIAYQAVISAPVESSNSVPWRVDQLEGIKI